MTRRQFVCAIILGLIIRLAGGFLYGTQDMEWWKAWGSYAVKENLTGIYGAPDREIVGLLREGHSRDEVRSATQRVIVFKPYKYSRTEYKLTQPPFYIYSLTLSTRLYRFVSPELANGRLFNFLLNFQPIAASALLAIIIGWFSAKLTNPSAGRLAAIAYWLNPVVLLNSPIQGYQDPICALFAVVSVVMLHRRRLVWAFVFLVFSFMTKPQGVLIAPVVVGVGLCEHRLLKNLAAWGAAVVTGLVICLPFLVVGRGLSMVQGVLSISDSSGDLSRQSMNIWWPLQYAYNAITAVKEARVGALSAILGGRYGWYFDVPAHRLTPILGFNVQIIGLVLLAAFTVANLWYASRRIRFDRSAIVVAAALQVYAYFILRAGVQTNHYFILVPTLALISFVAVPNLKQYLAVSAMFLVPDLVFYGLGRDFNYGLPALSRLFLGWTTNLLALANVALFVHLCGTHYRCAANAAHRGDLPPDDPRRA